MGPREGVGTQARDDDRPAWRRSSPRVRGLLVSLSAGHRQCQDTTKADRCPESLVPASVASFPHDLRSRFYHYFFLREKSATARPLYPSLKLLLLGKVFQPPRWGLLREGQRDTPHDSDTGFSRKPAPWGIRFRNKEQLALNLVVAVLTVIHDVNIVFCEHFS